MQSENTADLSAALAKAQGVMQAAKFDRTNPHFKSKYASLAAVVDAIRKPFADNGLSYTQTTEIREGGFVLVTTLRHSTGQWIASEYPLPMILKPQELGSALTYARRYSLGSIAGIASEDDDDANGAQANGQTASAPKAKESPVKPQTVSAPVNPETGEVSPHAIVATNDMQWGGAFVAAVKSAKTGQEIEQWIKLNKTRLDAIENDAPKIHDRLTANIDDMRARFDLVAA